MRAGPALTAFARRGVLWSKSISDRERAGLGGAIAFGDFRPVHDIPPSLQVVGAAILIGQVIGVLPNVVGEKRALAVHEHAVLVRAGLDGELAVARDGDDYPTGAKYPQTRGVEVGLKLLQPAEVTVDGGCDLAPGLPTARPHDLPE